VITSRISGSDPSFLTWDELVRLERLGFDIGSHTVHHVELAHVPAEEAWTELVDSRRSLQARLHRPIPWLSYPAGDVDPQVVDLARRAGYRLAVTTAPGNEQYASSPLLLHRDRVLGVTTVSELAALVESAQK
jgi:peptidoglycan/xylan/chitin deacetylase (PgdA/CDA1 family)